MNIQNTATNRTGIRRSGCSAPKTPSCCAAKDATPTTSTCPRQAYAYIVRSTVAHGRIKSIGTQAAKAMKGVLGVYTGEDMKAYGTLQSALPLKSKDGSD